MDVGGKKVGFWASLGGAVASFLGAMTSGGHAYLGMSATTIRTVLFVASFLFVAFSLVGFAGPLVVRFLRKNKPLGADGFVEALFQGDGE